MGVYTEVWTPNSGIPYSRNVGFDVVALEIDNFSAYYLYVQAADRYISPNTIGTILTVSHYSGQVVVTRVDGNPAYPVTDTGNLNSPVTIISYSDAVPPSPGVMANATIVNTVTVSGTLIVTGNVGITGPVTVNGSVAITGITTVAISGTPTVNIGGTVNANITAGTVNVQNVTNGILSATGVQLFLGTQSVGAAAGTFPIGAQVTSLIIRTPQAISGGQEYVVTVQTGPHSYALDHIAVAGSQTLICYIDGTGFPNPTVLVTGPVGYDCEVYSDTAMPLVGITNSGQQKMANSIPVAPATDWAPYLSSGHKRPYDAQLNTAPGAGVVAAIAFAGVANRRWVIDAAQWYVTNPLSAVSLSTDIKAVDSVAGVLWLSSTGIPAVRFSQDRVNIGPDWGLVGSIGGTITISYTANAPNVFQRVSAQAYLLPIGL